LAEGELPAVKKQDKIAGPSRREPPHFTTARLRRTKTGQKRAAFRPSRNGTLRHNRVFNGERAAKKRPVAVSIISQLFCFSERAVSP
jgi:hypothetical protein